MPDNYFTDENLPEEFRNIEKGINIENAKEYIEQSHPADLYEQLETCSPEKTETMGLALLDSETPISVKQNILSLFAHLGTLDAYRYLKKYCENPDKELDFWAEMALNECRMFLESDLLDGERGMVSSGLGGTSNALRYYFIFLPSEEKHFTAGEKQIIENEMFDSCKKFRCETDYFDFLDEYAVISVLIPFDVAVATFADNLIRQCNEYGNFMLEHYYVCNTDVPDGKEIEQIIEIIREG